MPDNLKSDIVSGSYSKLRISGITVNPTSGDNNLALERLEDLAEELAGRNIDLQYFFEDEPDAGSPHNMPRKFWDSMKSVLAGRLLPDFGKEMTQALQRIVSAGASFLYSGTATPQQTDYPRRMPIGSGNSLRSNRFIRFYRPLTPAPNAVATNKMFVDDVNDFVEHFDAYLLDGENVASYTIAANAGLTVVSDSLSTPDISYQIKADGTDSSATPVLFQVKIVATTSASRIVTRVINFEVTRTRDIP